MNNSLPDFNALWDYNNPATTRAQFLEILETHREKADIAYLLELKTQIARTHSLQLQFDEAHQILDEVEQQLNESLITPSIRYHLERGRTFNSAKEKAPAIEQFKMALELAESNQQDFYAIDAAHMLAIATPLEAQLKWNEKAMAMAEASSDEKAKKWLGSLYNNIGWTYHDQQNYAKALEHFQKGLAWREAQQDATGAFIAKWTIARTYRSLNQLDDALQLQLELLASIESGAAQEDGYVYEELGEIYLAKQTTEKAKPYFTKAYNLLSQDKWLQKHEANRLDRLRELSL